MSGVTGQGTTHQAKTLTAGFDRAGVEELSRLKNEPDWLRDQRLAAWAVFEQTPWPTGKEEEWRRLDLRSFQLDDYRPYSDPEYRASALTDLPENVRAAVGKSQVAGALVQHDSAGVYRWAGNEATNGVIFESLDTAVREHPDLVRTHLGTVVRPEDGKFAALHAAFWSGGTFLYVPAGVEITLPFRTVHWAGAEGLGVFNHTLIVVERNASVTFIDDYVSAPETKALDSGGVELVVGEGAQMRYVSLQDWGRNVASFNFLRGKTGRDATVNWLLVSLGAKTTRLEVDAELGSQGGKHEILGLCFGDGSQQFDVHTLQSHLAPNTTSDFLLKGVLKDTARSAFSGLIRVAPGAQKTDAYLANRNLLLSDKARADAIPTLEIEANDVRCTHGATVGPVDQEQVFYLMARGLSRRDAERLIVEGFLEPLLSRIPLPEVRERLDVSISRKMAD